MSEENALALPQGQALVTYDESAIEQMMSASSWLPRLAVQGGSSNLVKEGKMPIGRFALIKDKEHFVDLGDTIEVLAISVRPKALDTSTGTPLEYYNPNSESFKKTQAKSDTQDSGCMFGPDYLVWIPSQNTFASLFCSSKTTRREAPNILAEMKKAGEKNGKSIEVAMVTLKVKFIKPEKSKHSWHAFAATPCSTPCSVYPENAEFLEVLNKFQNPKESVVEVVQPAAGTDRAR